MGVWRELAGRRMAGLEQAGSGSCRSWLLSRSAGIDPQPTTIVRRGHLSSCKYGCASQCLMQTIGYCYQEELELLLTGQLCPAQPLYSLAE
jgi:hypothetical protein